MSKCARPMPCAVCVGFSRSCAATACAKRSRFLAILPVSTSLRLERSAPPRQAEPSLGCPRCAPTPACSSRCASCPGASRASTGERDGTPSALPTASAWPPPRARKSWPQLLALAERREAVVGLGTGTAWSAIALALGDRARRVVSYDPSVRAERDAYFDSPAPPRASASSCAPSSTARGPQVGDPRCRAAAHRLRARASTGARAPSRVA